MFTAKGKGGKNCAVRIKANIQVCVDAGTASGEIRILVEDICDWGTYPNRNLTIIIVP